MGYFVLILVIKIRIDVIDVITVQFTMSRDHKQSFNQLALKLWIWVAPLTEGQTTLCVGGLYS